MLAQDFGNGVAKQVHEQKRDAGHEKMHPMRGFRLFRELPEK